MLFKQKISNTIPFIKGYFVKRGDMCVVLIDSEIWNNRSRLRMVDQLRTGNVCLVIDVKGKAVKVFSDNTTGWVAGHSLQKISI